MTSKPIARIVQASFALFMAVAIAFAPSGAQPRQAKAPAERPCTNAERDQGNAALDLNQAQQRAATAIHLPWGVPVPNYRPTNEHLLVSRDYVNSYDGDLRVPLWSAEQIVAAEQLGKLPQRIRCFRPDPRIARIDDSQNAQSSDYVERIYDQGHITPAADQERSVSAQVNSFLYTNMAPQTCQFNRGIWQILESITRLWTQAHPTLYVLSGSVFDRDGNGARDPDGSAQPMESSNGQRRVGVPSAFYKIIAFQEGGGPIQTISIMMPHNEANPVGESARQYLQSHIVTIAAIERVTGLDLFPNARAIQEARTLWAFRGAVPGSLCMVGQTGGRARPPRRAR